VEKTLACQPQGKRSGAAEGDLSEAIDLGQLRCQALDRLTLALDGQEHPTVTIIRSLNGRAEATYTGENLHSRQLTSSCQAGVLEPKVTDILRQERILGKLDTWNGISMSES
jgi:hypothetical protein